ncbi:MAG: alkane 1-monooxygenase [Gammaproteobacteria bacterium]
MSITRTARHGHVKRFGYLIFLTPPLLPWIGVWLWQRIGYADALAFFTLLFLFALIPILDRLVGKDPVNLQTANFETLSEDRYYRRLTYLCVPVMIASLWFGAWGMANFDLLGPIGLLGWALSHGAIGSALGFNAAHELIHKNTRHERLLGDLLLAMVCYSGFRIEHLRGHHLHVSTPRDQSSAALGQSLFHFLPRAIAGNVLCAWTLERERLQRKGLPVVSHRNELLRGYAVSLAIAAALTMWFGLAGLVFFLLQSMMAIITLETVNYLEHYGLTRKRKANGKYERTTHQHSWNSNYLLTNMLLFQLQRHSDHHEFPARRYQVLRHIDDSPQLPAGYATMMVLAWCPPLWRRIMDPRVQAYYRDDSPQGLPA